MTGTDEITRLEVKIENESVWLTQEQIAILFGVKRPAITKHIRNIFDINELEANSVCSILERTAADGKTYKSGFYKGMIYQFTKMDYLQTVILNGVKHLLQILR